MKENNKIIKPFLRWAGGKTWLTREIENYLPAEINNYYEPFLGSGAIFFYLKSRKLVKGNCYLSDANKELINTYQVIKGSVNELIASLQVHENTQEFYYDIRSKMCDNPIERAARFLFLNRTSFNGIYRVNRQGLYNVPFGYRKITRLYDFDSLRDTSDLFKNCFFSVRDFKKVVDKVNPGDLVFVDPPYTVAHENNGFIQYNQSLFSWENQIELSNFLIELNSKQSNFIMTNAAHISIENLYNNCGKKLLLSRASTIGGVGAKRTKYHEFLFTNI